jgi:hypothetical protein
MSGGPENGRLLFVTTTSERLEIVNGNEAAKIAARASSFAELDLGKLTIHKAPGWVALPYGAGIDDFGDREFTRIAELARRTGDEHVWVVDADLPLLRSTPHVARYPADASRLRDVIERFPLADVFLLSWSSAWAVLASELAFSVVVGHPEHSTFLLENEPHEAIRAYRSSLAHWQAVPPYIAALANAPWESYESLSPGTDFVVKWPLGKADSKKLASQ